MQTPATRWSTPVSSKVNLPHAIDFRALCGANFVTYHSKVATLESAYSAEWNRSCRQADSNVRRLSPVSRYNPNTRNPESEPENRKQNPERETLTSRVSGIGIEHPKPVGIYQTLRVL